MSVTRYLNPFSGEGGGGVAGVVDPSPLLAGGGGRRVVRPSLGGAARLVREAAGRRRALREPSVLVREAAAAQLEERQEGWARSRAVVFLDAVWNLAFAAAGAAVLAASSDETPRPPLRVWAAGYALQCVVHVVCILLEYPARRETTRGADSPPNSPRRSAAAGGGGYDSDGGQDDDDVASSVAKHLESANTMFSFFWWIIGFYWVSAGGERLTQDAPQLYWMERLMRTFSSSQHTSFDALVIEKNCPVE